MDEVRPGPDYSSAPLADFGQPRGSEWINDAVHASKWVSSYGKISTDPVPYVLCGLIWIQ
jgi:hypothetical protein